MVRLSVIIPSAGRHTLENTVESALRQLNDSDELIVVGSRRPQQFKSDYSKNQERVCRFVHRGNGGTLSNQLSVRTGKEVGHPSGAEERDLGDAVATGTHLLHCDDDDIYTKNAFGDIRRVVALNPECVHIFQMKYGMQPQWVSPYSVDIDGEPTLGVHEAITLGNFGGMQMVFPRVTPNPLWNDGRNMAEDYFVTKRYLEALDTGLIWPHITIGIIRPTAEQIAEHTGREVQPIYAPQPFWDGRVDARRKPERPYSPTMMAALRRVMKQPSQGRPLYVNVCTECDYDWMAPENMPSRCPKCGRISRIEILCINSGLPGEKDRRYEV